MQSGLLIKISPDLEKIRIDNVQIWVRSVNGSRRFLTAPNLAVSAADFQSVTDKRDSVTAEVTGSTPVVYGTAGSGTKHDCGLIDRVAPDGRAGTHRGHIKLFLATLGRPSSASVFL
jgi:hypothetical protein